MSAARVREGIAKILLVDDYAGTAEVLRQILLQLGYYVISYTSSIEAFEDFKADPGKFDLVLTDFDMPKMNGDQLAQKITAIRPSIPIIINTGNSHNITAEMAKAIGIRGVLRKPTTISKLATMIRKVLDDTRTKKRVTT
jgi:CheY-like chemotaxis protein